MEMTLDELRALATSEIKRRFRKFVVVPYCGALIHNGTSYARIDLTDEELIANRNDIERYVAGRSDAAEVQITGKISNRS